MNRTRDESNDLIDQAMAECPAGIGAVFAVDFKSAQAMRKAADECWRFLQTKVNDFEEPIQRLSEIAAEAMKRGDSATGNMASLANAALMELLARKLERESREKQAAGN